MEKQTVLTNSYRDQIEREQAEQDALATAPVRDRLPRPRFLKVGDRVRALGKVYRVRKVTGKDVVMRPVLK